MKQCKRRSFLFILLLSVVTGIGLTACSGDDLEGSPGYDGQQYSISVTDGGYTSASDGIHTKAVEQGYRTVFTAGDQIGVFAVKNGEIITEVNNLCLTAADESGNLVWKDTGSNHLLRYTGATYYAYYPYQTTLTGSLNPVATDAATFFDDVITNWTPDKDQGTYAKYTAQDLMVAKGTTSGNGITFAMAHQMTLAVIQSPKIKYSFSNSSPAIADYTTDHICMDFDGYIPYRMNDGAYRYLVRPGSTDMLTGGYTTPSGVAKGWEITPTIASAGNYKTYAIDGGQQLSVSGYTLQVGDFMMKDGSLVMKGTSLTDAQKANCIGIVFSVGHNANDKSDYSATGIGEARCRGYVIALTDAKSNNFCKWGVYNQELGLYKDAGGNPISNLYDPQLDWNGYSYTQSIITAAGGESNLNGTMVTGYPATYYAVVSYRNAVPAPASSSGWFLPAIGQLKSVFDNRGLLDYVSAGGKNFVVDNYWSSSEYNDSPNNLAIIMRFFSASVGRIEKNIDYCFVRSVSSF